MQIKSYSCNKLRLNLYHFYGNFFKEKANHCLGALDKVIKIKI